MRIILICIGVIVFFSCRKEGYNHASDAPLTISTDRLTFDTVFTNTGSVTQIFKIINENDQKLLLETIKLAGGNSSPFKLNIDGRSSSEVQQITIGGGDSLYVFVQVNIDPSNENLPFVVEDSVEISYNGNTRKVFLEAWGQDAHFLRDHQINGDITWTNDKPYVILGYLHIPENQTLLIEKGCRIYIHADAPVVVDGTLSVNGGKDSLDRVSFQGDRLDKPYKDFPASWPGIFFSGSSQDNIFRYAVIKNAMQALAVIGPATNSNPKLRLEQIHIDNAYDAGIITENSSVEAVNCLISNCGRNIVITKGGDYHFNHCTVVSISNDYVNHKNPVLTITNHDIAQNTAPLTATFMNSIFWGENGLSEEEVVVSKMGNSNFQVNFDHGIWKVTTTPANVNATQMMISSPEFDTIDATRQLYNFRLREFSPARESGINSTVTVDLDGNPRPVGIPDLGCFEYQ